ncbi:hypothetical protein JOB18_020542 [Solea senegalensis]|uniref:Uncharacterized protein n=1 Tax=Solea senegalensis TaxID=28829 RepID=A0AAV6SZ21_SOLSE|nr:hypothetical protein JOB18_020542 [Solea senegalensis]
MCPTAHEGSTLFIYVPRGNVPASQSERRRVTGVSCDHSPCLPCPRPQTCKRARSSDSVHSSPPPPPLLLHELIHEDKRDKIKTQTHRSDSVNPTSNRGAGSSSFFLHFLFCVL